MDEKALFTRFWTEEAQTTRKVLARIPEHGPPPCEQEGSVCGSIQAGNPRSPREPERSSRPLSESS